MASLFVVYILCILMLRFTAGYDSRYQRGKFIKIKSPVLRKILLDKMSFEERRYRLKKDIDKMSVSGLVLYIVAFIVFLFILVFLCFVPPIPTDVFMFEGSRFFIYLDTFNKKAAAVGIAAFFCLTVLYISFNLILSAKFIKTKGVKVFSYIVGIFLAAMVVFCIVSGIIFCSMKTTSS